MKILFIASWYPTAKNHYSGIFVKEHAKAARNTGNEVTVLAIVVHRCSCLWRKRITDSIDENGIRTVLIEIDTCFRDVVYHAIPLQYRIVKNYVKNDLLNSFSPDLIHSNVVFPAGIIGDKLAQNLGIPHIVTEHWSQLRKFLKKPLFSQMGINVYNNAARILPVSEYLKQEIIDSVGGTIPVDKFRVIGNVVDSRIFKYKTKTLCEDEIRICTIGTWNNTRNITKRPELLIEAISIIQTEFDKKIKLTMVGGGNRLDELKELCRTKSVAANFTGYLNSIEVATLLHSSDYMAHCSNVETFGIVVAEALMTGTPVICSNTGALIELMAEERGVVKGVTCENTLSDWLHKLKIAFLWRFDNESIAKEIGDKYSLDAISAELGEVYDELFCQIKKMD